MTDGGGFFKNFVAWFIPEVYLKDYIFHSGKICFFYVNNLIFDGFKVEESNFLNKIGAIILEGFGWHWLVLVYVAPIFLWWVSCWLC